MILYWVAVYLVRKSYVITRGILHFSATHEYVLFTSELVALGEIARNFYVSFLRVNNNNFGDIKPGFYSTAFGKKRNRR